MGQISSLKKIRDLDIYRDEAWYCGPGPSAAVYADGEIVVAFRRSKGEGHGHHAVEACVVRSTDGGQTWSEPTVFDSGPIRNQNLTLLSDGTLLIAMPSADLITRQTYESIRDAVGGSARYHGGYYQAERGSYIRRSSDRGRTWSQRYYADSVPGWDPVLPGFSAPLEIRARVIELRNGTLLFPAYIFSFQSEDDSTVPDRTFGPKAMASQDGGRTWTHRGDIATSKAGIDFDETEVIECPSGKIVAFMRPTFANNEDMYLYTAVSVDGGSCWSSPRKHDLWGYPISPLTMPSGRVLLAYGYRRPPFGIRARLVDPECEDIDQAEELVVRDDGSIRDLGYPQSALLDDGTAFISYYMNDVSDDGSTKYICASVVEERYRVAR